MPSEENIMSINKIIGVKREKEKGTSLRKRGCSGCTVYSVYVSQYERGGSRSLYKVA